MTDKCGIIFSYELWLKMTLFSFCTKIINCVCDYMVSSGVNYAHETFYSIMVM